MAFKADDKVYIVVDSTATPADIRQIVVDGKLEIEDFKGNVYILPEKDVFPNLKSALSHLFTEKM